MNLNTFLLALTAFLYFSFSSPLVMDAQAQNPLRGAKVCVNNDKDIVVVRRRCPSPRFTEVTPEALENATTLGGVSADRYLSNFIVVNETYNITLPSIGNFAGNSASCPNGYVVTGGGVSIIDNVRLTIRRSIPSTNLSSWTGTVEASANNASGTLSIYAICALGQRFTEEE